VLLASLPSLHPVARYTLLFASLPSLHSLRFTLLLATPCFTLLLATLCCCSLHLASLCSSLRIRLACLLASPCCTLHPAARFTLLLASPCCSLHAPCQCCSLHPAVLASPCCARFTLLLMRHYAIILIAMFQTNQQSTCSTRILQHRNLSIASRQPQS
jgi:hypothetical protein